MTDANTAQCDPAAAPTSPETLQAALDAPCVVLLRSHKGRFTACIPELGLLCAAATVEAAHAKILRQREARIREFAAEEMLDKLPRPLAAQDTMQNSKRLLPQLKVFLIKATIAVVLFLGAVNIVSNGLRNVGYVLEKKLDSVTYMTPESVEAHRAKAAKIAMTLGPILREVTVMFATPVSGLTTAPVEAGDTATRHR